jgi:hypothetical protein
MAFFPTEGDGILSNLPNLFITNNPLEGVLTPEQNKELRNKAMTQGLLGTALNYLAQPKTENYGSAVPYLAKAYLGGMGSSQNVYDTATKNLLDRLNLEKTARATELQGMTEIDKLYASRDKIAAKDPNDPRLAVYDEAIKTKSTRGDGLSINLGQPMTAINPKTGKEELVQFPNRPGEKPIFTGLQKPEAEVKLKPIPAGPATAYSENNAAIKAVDDAIAKVEAAPENTFGLKNYLPGAVTQRIDKPGIDARSAVAAIGSKKYHDISGAAVTISEAPRMAPFIPSATDTKDKILQNLRNIRTQYEDTNSSLSSVYNEDQGYRPLNVKPATTSQPAVKNQQPENKSKSVVRTGKDKSGKTVVQYSDGSIGYAD